MTQAQNAHLKRLVEQFQCRASLKYRKGQQDHGGNLWVKSGLLDMAIDEAIDLVIYLLTLKEQLGD